MPIQRIHLKTSENLTRNRHLSHFIKMVMKIQMVFSRTHSSNSQINFIYLKETTHLDNILTFQQINKPNYELK